MTSVLIWGLIAKDDRFRTGRDGNTPKSMIGGKDFSWSAVDHDGPGGVLEAVMPPTDPTERTLLLNEWQAHRKKTAELAPEALDMDGWVICSGSDDSELAARETLLKNTLS